MCVVMQQAFNQTDVPVADHRNENHRRCIYIFHLAPSGILPSFLFLAICVTQLDPRDPETSAATKLRIAGKSILHRGGMAGSHELRRP